MTAPIRPDPFAALDAPAPDPFAALDAPAPDPFAALDAPAPRHSLGQSAATAVRMLGHLATHPWELPQGIVNDAIGALTPNMLRPGVPVAPRVPVGTAPYAARSDATYVSDPSKTRGDPGAQEKALLNTLVNAGLIALPEVGLPAKLALGAGVGAYYTPKDRLAGALTGLTLGGVLHGAGRLAAKVKAAPDVPLDAAPETPLPAPEPAASAPPPPPPPAAAPSVAAPAADRFAALDAAPETPLPAASAPPPPIVAAAPADRVAALEATPELSAPPPAAPPPLAPVAPSDVPIVPDAGRPLPSPRTNPLALPDAEFQQVADAHAAQLQEGGGTATDERMHTLLQSDLQRRGLPASPDAFAALDPASVASEATSPSAPTTYQGPPVPDVPTPESLHAGFPSEWVQSSLGTTVVKSLRQAFLPTKNGPEAAETGNIIRAQNASAARDVVIGQVQRAQFAQQIGTLPIPQQLTISHAIEGGTSLPEYAPAIAAVRNALDTERDAIRALGTGALDTYMENYLPHLWTDPVKAAEIAQTLQAPQLIGTPGFLQPRTIETLQQGIDLGLTPKYPNPVDAANVRIREMRRYRMGVQITQEMQAKGLDPLTSAPVANVLNNFLTPGLRGKPIFDSYMAVGNTLNQAQLGLSAFHAGMTTINGMVSQVGLGVGALLHGDVLGAGKLLLTAPTAPITQFLKGSQLLQEYSKPGSVGGPMTAMADAVVQGGGRIQADFQPQHLQAFRAAWRSGDVIGGVKTLVPAMLDAVAYPTMQLLVPRMKLGVFYDLAQREMQRLPPGASVDVVRAAMGRAWNSVDNRFGQVVYDNLFWNRTMTDMLHASTRSVGWNWGSIAEGGGGIADWHTLAKQLAAGKRGAITPRMEFTLALPLTAGLLGAVTQYLYTGQGPTSLKDYFYPQTGGVDQDGNPERIQLPTYMKDVRSYFSHTIQTAMNKTNPLLSAGFAMLQNQNFYGDEIRNPDDPALTQLQQLLGFGVKQYVPFSITNTQEQMRRDAGNSSLAAKAAGVVRNSFGLTPAPRSVIRTPAQNTMAEALGARAPQTRTPEQVATTAVKRDAQQRASRGDWSGVVSAVQQGVMPPKAVLPMARRIAKGTPSLVTRFNMLSLPDAERVYTQGTPAEQNLWRYAITLKRLHALRSPTTPFADPQPSTAGLPDSRSFDLGGHQP